jgi:hypothetical protein
MPSQWDRETITKEFLAFIQAKGFTTKEIRQKDMFALESSYNRLEVRDPVENLAANSGAYGSSRFHQDWHHEETIAWTNSHPTDFTTDPEQKRIIHFPLYSVLIFENSGRLHHRSPERITLQEQRWFLRICCPERRA